MNTRYQICYQPTCAGLNKNKQTKKLKQKQSFANMQVASSSAKLG